MSSTWTVVVVALCSFAAAATADPKALRCLVCRNAVDEFETAVRALNPSKTVEVGDYRLDADGTGGRKRVPLSRSQAHLSEMIDEVCSKMADYVRVRYKATGKYAVLKMTVDGGMNPEFSLTDFVTDEDLNKSLEFYCEEILTESEDEFVKLYTERDDDAFPDGKPMLCEQTLRLCEDWMLPDERDRDWNSDKEKQRGADPYGFGGSFARDQNEEL